LNKDVDVFGPLLHGTARAWRLKLDERLKPMGLSQAKWRTLMHLSIAPGPLTQSEIATKLNTPLGTIKTRMRSGMIKLRALLGSQLENFG